MAGILMTQIWYINTNIQVPAFHGWRPNTKAWLKDIEDMILQQQKNIDSRI